MLREQVQNEGVHQARQPRQHRRHERHDGDALQSSAPSSPEAINYEELQNFRTQQSVCLASAGPWPPTAPPLQSDSYSTMPCKRMTRRLTFRPRALAAATVSERCRERHSDRRPLQLPTTPMTPVQQNNPAHTCRSASARRMAFAATHATGLGLCMLCVWQALLASYTPGWSVMTSNQCSTALSALFVCRVAWDGRAYLGNRDVGHGLHKPSSVQQREP